MQTLHKLAMAAIGAALFTGCASLAREPVSPEAPAAQAEPPARPGAPKDQEAAPKIVSLPYRVDLTYSPAARDRLGALAARLGVSADYYGAPKDPAAANLDPELGIWLGGEMEVLRDARTSVTMRGEIDASRAAREVAGDVRVRVLAFPVQSPLAANEVTCETFDDVLALTMETGAVIHCTLQGN
jgi:hypothetical protein